MTVLENYSHKQYLNLETFRKSGMGVRTPVWFCQEGDCLYVLTMACSGKVKRIHNNGKVNITPCKMDGTPVSTWNPALAEEITDPETIRKVNAMMNKKYGLMNILLQLNSSRKKQASAILKIKLS
jgi:uncharacterized protein